MISEQCWSNSTQTYRTFSILAQNVWPGDNDGDGEIRPRNRKYTHLGLFCCLVEVELLGPTQKLNSLGMIIDPVPMTSPRDYL